MLFFAFIDNNLFLPLNGLGLLEHCNIWIFLFSNLLIPIAIFKSYEAVKTAVDESIINNINSRFMIYANANSTKVLTQFITAVGFCYFVGNSLQNASILNKLEFDYWDSINYICSYVASRFYKLYLFVFFIPTVLIYMYVLIKSVSVLITIDDMNAYPIKNYRQLNVLCNFVLDLLFIILVPFILLACGVYFVHNRFDITTISTIALSIFCILVYLILYAVSIKKYYEDMTKYKTEHLKQIDSKLIELHKQIMKYQFCTENTDSMSDYLEMEEYLSKIKRQITQLPKFPLIVKALSTSLITVMPTILKIACSAFENLF